MIFTGCCAMGYLLDSITSKAYWQYVFASWSGFKTVLAVFGTLYLVIESLDFFGVITRDVYGDLALPAIFAISIVVSVVVRRPISEITVTIPNQDVHIQVVVGNLLEFCGGATMISTNTLFESDVAGGKIAPDSLQGQFTARFFTGNQGELVRQLRERLSDVGRDAPYPIGTTVEVNTHGKTFYFTAMSVLNESGNASSTVDDVRNALEGLWRYVREQGELQAIAVPVVGTGRGRLQETRKRMVGLIAESFVRATEVQKFSDRLVIFVSPRDARKFRVNLYDIKDHIRQKLFS